MGKASQHSQAVVGTVPPGGHAVEPEGIETRIGLLADQFARDVLAVIRGSRLDDLMAVAQGNGLPDGVGGAVGALGRRAAAVLAFGSAVAEPRRRRRWPTCGQAGCTNSYYPASGTSHLCYKHFIASGGRHPNAKR